MRGLYYSVILKKEGVNMINLSDIVWKIVKTNSKVELLARFEDECLEIAEVVTEYRRGKIDYITFATKIADLIILCECMKKVLGSDVVNRKVDTKLAQLETELDIFNKIR